MRHLQHVRGGANAPRAPWCAEGAAEGGSDAVLGGAEGGADAAAEGASVVAVLRGADAEVAVLGGAVEGADAFAVQCGADVL